MWVFNVFIYVSIHATTLYYVLVREYKFIVETFQTADI